MLEKQQKKYKILYFILTFTIAVIYIGYFFFNNKIFVDVSITVSSLVFLVSSILPYRYFTEKELRRVYFYLIVATFSLLVSEASIFLKYIHPEFSSLIIFSKLILHLIFYLFFAFCISSFLKFWVVPIEKIGSISKVFFTSFLCLLAFFILNTYVLILNGKLIFGEHIIYTISSSLDVFFIPLLAYTLHIFKRSVFEESWLIILVGIVLEFLGSFGEHLAIIEIISGPLTIVFQVMIISGYLTAGYGFSKQIF